MLNYDFSSRYRYIIPFKAAFYRLEEAETYCEKMGISLYDSFEHHYDGPVRITTPTMTYENKFMARVIFKYQDGLLRNIEIEDRNPDRTSFPIKIEEMEGRSSHFLVETPDKAWSSQAARFNSFSSCGPYASKGIGTWYSDQVPFLPCPISKDPLEYPILIG